MVFCTTSCKHGQFGIIEDAMDALAEGLQAVQTFKRRPDQEKNRVTPLAHGQLLHHAQARIVEELLPAKFSSMKTT